MSNIEYKRQFIEGYEGLYEIDTNGKQIKVVMQNV